MRTFQRERLAPYWPPGRAYVDDEYRSLPFPFETLPAPSFAMTAHWTRAHLLGYISSWSAVARCHTAEGLDPLPDVAEALEALWPDADRAVTITWPLHLKAGRSTYVKT